jgi:restriction system protein
MAVMPTWDEFMVPVLRVLADGGVRALREIRDATTAAVGLSDDQLAEESASGYSKATNRIGWAASYLSRVGALDRPARGRYVITDIGRRLLVTHSEGITEPALRALARDGDQWWVAKKSNTNPVPVIDDVVTTSPLDPVEQIEEGIARINADVVADLLTRLHQRDPGFFEQAVLDLLMGMGYGGTEGRATRTQLSHDGGIDGIVDQDALGLSRIYVQAKRYALDATVGRPEVQAFVGALHGNQANQGVFITTGRFSSGARDYAGSVPTRVVLIDGQRLTALMIRYGVGVQVRQTVHIVEVDEDFFE